MRPSESFKTFIKDQLAQFGPVSIRAMFGGAGIFAGDVMFAFIVDDTLYIKASEATASALKAEGMQPFTYMAKGGKPISIDYWSVPPHLLEEPDELTEWAHEAHRTALASKAKSAKSKAQASKAKTPRKSARKRHPS